jgi:hypothetical protein
VVKIRKTSVLAALSGSPGRKNEQVDKVEGKTLSPSASSDSIVFEPESASAPAPDREIHHLIFVVHGIGQKMQEKVVSMDLAEEVGVLRSTLIKSSENFSTLVPEDSTEIPKGIFFFLMIGGGIQVLPIMWRSNMEVQTEAAGSKITLEDITLEGTSWRLNIQVCL